MKDINGSNPQVNLTTQSGITENMKFWLGGFVEGEGTICASIKRQPTSKFGFRVQPEFRVTQHVNGKHILEAFKELFNGKGRVQPKPGSTLVWEFVITGLTSLNSLVLPFYLNYVVPFSGKTKEFQIFQQIVEMGMRKEHLNLEGMKEIIQLAYTLNEDGKGKQRKRTLEEVLEIISVKQSS